MQHHIGVKCSIGSYTYVTKHNLKPDAIKKEKSQKNVVNPIFFILKMEKT